MLCLPDQAPSNDLFDTEWGIKGEG